MYNEELEKLHIALKEKYEELYQTELSNLLMKYDRIYEETLKEIHNIIKDIEQHELLLKNISKEIDLLKSEYILEREESIKTLVEMEEEYFKKYNKRYYYKVFYNEDNKLNTDFFNF